MNNLRLLPPPAYYIDYVTQVYLYCFYFKYGGIFTKFFIMALRIFPTWVRGSEVGPWGPGPGSGPTDPKKV